VSVVGAVVVASIVWFALFHADAVDQTRKFPAEPATTEATIPLDSTPADENGFGDLLYFADSRLVILRIHIFIDGEPFVNAWNESIGTFYRSVDRDGDGVLAGDEPKRLPSPVEYLHLGLIIQPHSAAAHARLIDIDPPDGVITRQELAVYMRHASGGPLLVHFAQQAQVAMQSSPSTRRRAPDTVIFEKLDGDRDNQLSPAEVEAAGARLMTLDADDDESVSLANLQSNPAALLTPEESTEIIASPWNAAFEALFRGIPFRKLAGQVIDRYDRRTPAPTAVDDRSVKDRRLSRAQLGLPEAAFAPFDANGDNALDIDELEGLLRAPVPTVAVNVRLGRRMGAEQPVEIISSEPGFSASVREAPGGSVTLLLAGAQLEIVARNATPADNKQKALDNFTRADVDKNGYLDRQEVDRHPAIARGLQQMDRNGDGKVFENELLALLDLEANFAGAQTMLMVMDHGRDLFQLLDVNRDTRLSLRELKSVEPFLAQCDADRDGWVAQDEIPTHYRLTVSRGRTPGFSGGMRLKVTPEAESDVEVSSTIHGPRWFQAMDRNRDGDVSCREFLGTREQFEKLDADGDGLIDADEAATVE
jgi:Ca2+-binding EF-hand superfamily protein